MLWHGSHSFLKLHSLNTSGLQLQSLSLQWDCSCPAASMGKGFVGAGVIGACVLKQTQEKEQILLPSATADPSSKSPGSSFRELHTKGFHRTRACETFLLPSCPGFWSISALASMALPSCPACSSHSHCCLPLAAAHLPKCCQRQQSWLRIPVGFWSLG